MVNSDYIVRPVFAIQSPLFMWPILIFFILSSLLFSLLIFFWLKQWACFSCQFPFRQWTNFVRFGFHCHWKWRWVFVCDNSEMSFCLIWKTVAPSMDAWGLCTLCNRPQMNIVIQYFHNTFCKALVLSVFIDVYGVFNGRTESETELTAKNGFDESGSCRYFFLCLVLVFLFHFRYVGYFGVVAFIFVTLWLWACYILTQMKKEYWEKVLQSTGTCDTMSLLDGQRASSSNDTLYLCNAKLLEWANDVNLS